MSAPEKTVQRAVTRFLLALGYVVSDLSQPRASMQTAGLPDLFAMHPRLGHALWIEVKAARGRVSPAQADWHNIARRAGQMVVVARSATDLVGPLRELGNPITSGSDA